MDAADVRAFDARTRQDGYQFRFIVSPEDATRLAELREFTRGLMGKMERDLATRLDWVAVDHWDTDNPHTHIVLRGVDDSGEDLFIAREYISHGMRFRACRLATDWLGPRTEREILGEPEPGSRPGALDQPGSAITGALQGSPG